MKRTILFLIALTALLLFGGCAAEEQVNAPVTAAPALTEDVPVTAEPEPEIRILQDLTKSMLGFAGSDQSAISRTVLALTNHARFDSDWHTCLLEPDEDRDLQWEACNPLLVAAALINKNDDSSYTTAGDFDEGGPVYSVFSGEPDPGQVRVLITDLMEQEGQLGVLCEYTEQLFRAESHQQLYIAAANSAYSGRVSFPKIEGEEVVIDGCQYQGERPFVIIAAGPRTGIDELRAVLAESGVDFAEFLVENRRDAGLEVVFAPAQTLTQEILVGDMSQAHCTIDLTPIAGIEGGYIYDKVSADHTRSAQLALHALTEAELSLGSRSWMCWQQLPASEETIPDETTEAPAAQWGWVPCDPPEGVRVELHTLEGGSAIAAQTAEHSGLEDIAVPQGKRLYELRVQLGEETAGTAFCLRTELVTPVANPLASAAPFEQWDISFSLYGKAAEDPAILQRIPDLGLLLNALTGLDAAEPCDKVGEILLVIQNYS